MIAKKFEMLSGNSAVDELLNAILVCLNFRVRKKSRKIKAAILAEVKTDQ